MTDQLEQQISAFVDNELPDEECTLLVRRLSKDEALGHTLNRYALIGDAMRGELLAADVQLGQRVSAAIAAGSFGDAADDKQPGTWARFARPLSGIAVAATVAAVAVLSLQGFDGPGSSELPSNTVAEIATDDGRTLRPISLPRLELPTVQPASVMPQSRMDRYLLRHSEYANGFGRQSVMGIRGVGTYTLVPVPTKNAETPATSEADSE